MKVVALAGGVGGAKMVDGLAMILPPEDLSVVVNTGDDFVHYGLKICPDLDTICYTLAGIANPKTGWGRDEETWFVAEELEKLGSEMWFKLGDRDLATHLERTRRLNRGDSLSKITRAFCQKWDIKQDVYPMCDEPIPTKVLTEEGELSFQEYFVHRQFKPVVKGFRFVGIDQARPSEGIIEMIENSELVIICPSNPWVSIGPIISLAGIRESLRKVPVVGVSPIVGGKAVKGPAAKMFKELGFSPSSVSVAKLYKDFLNGFAIDIVDKEDETSIKNMGIETLVTQTVMRNREDRRILAKEVIDYFVRL